MRIKDIYSNYKILPSLQTHMLRVAAVAKIISDNFNHKIDKTNIVKACLVHDMGNIVKFNLRVYPQFLEPEGFDFWEDVKNSFIKKYGENEHEASVKITKELGLTPQIVELVHCIGFMHAKDNYLTKDFSKKICAYSDLRVAPYGVVSLNERIYEGRNRFRLNHDNKKKIEVFEQGVKYVVLIEQQIFENAKIQPDYIDNKSVSSIMYELENFEVE